MVHQINRPKLKTAETRMHLKITIRKAEVCGKGSFFCITSPEHSMAHATAASSGLVLNFGFARLFFGFLAYHVYMAVLQLLLHIINLL